MDKTGKILLISVGTMFSCIIIICLTQGDINCRFDSCYMYITDCQTIANSTNCTLVLEYKPNSYCYEECEYSKCPKNNTICKSGIWTKNCNINDKCNVFAQIMFYVSIIILSLSAIFVTGWFAFFWKPVDTYENQPLIPAESEYLHTSNQH